MSFVTCPCGFKADGFAADALAAYKAHQCDYHDAEPASADESSTWPGALAGLVFWVAVVLMCGICAWTVTR